MKKTKHILALLIIVLSLQTLFAQSRKDQIFRQLTGGAKMKNGKTWKLVPDPRKTGIGPIGDTLGAYYNFPTGLTGDAWNNGALKNTFTFTADSLFIPENKYVTAHWSHANMFFGRYQATYEDVNLQDPYLSNARFVLKQDTGVSYSTNYRLELPHYAYLGYYEQRHQYQIISISEDTLHVCNTFHENAAYGTERDSTMRCFRYVNVPNPYSVTNQENEIFRLLTGGSSMPNGKTWKLSGSPRHFTIGPKGDITGLYYNFPEGLTGTPWVEGALQNSFTFRPDGTFIPQNQNVTVHYAYANRYFGTNQPSYSDINLTDTDLQASGFIFKKDTGVAYSTNYRIELNDKSYLGYYEKRHQYQIININADSLFVCNTSNDDPFADPSADQNFRCATYYTVDNPLGITDNIVNKASVKVFPNPATDVLNFSEKAESYLVLNNLGTVVFKGNEETVNIASLLPGHYIIKWTNIQGTHRVAHFTKE